MQELLDRLHPKADRKGLAFRVRQPPEIVLEADRTKLARMCDNLAQNAIAYTPSGGRLVVDSEPGKGTRARLFVPAHRITAAVDATA